MEAFYIIFAIYLTAIITHGMTMAGAKTVHHVRVDHSVRLVEVKVFPSPVKNIDHTICVVDPRMPMNRVMDECYRNVIHSITPDLIEWVTVDEGFERRVSARIKILTPIPKDGI